MNAESASEIATATRILVAGGMGNLVLSFFLGWVLSGKRMHAPIGQHRWLLVAHEVSLQEGLLLMAVAFAAGFARLPGVWAIAGAWLLVVGSLFQDASGIANWLRGVDDQFASRSAGWVLAAINAVVNTAGLLIWAVGVVLGLTG